MGPAHTYTQTYKNTPNTQSQTDPGKYSWARWLMEVCEDVQTGSHRHSFLEAAWTWATASLCIEGSRSQGWLSMGFYSCSAGVWGMLGPRGPLTSSALPSLSIFTNSSSRKPSFIIPFLSVLGEEADPRRDAAWILPQSFPSHTQGEGCTSPELSGSRSSTFPAPVLPRLQITAQMSPPSNPWQFPFPDVAPALER